ncbi:hypothetical protein [Methanooceanicella nereidis]|nr:hypothetical protein [Methanocella sp. CWC-04]
MAVTISGCAGQKEVPQNDKTPVDKPYLKGVSLSPKSWEQADVMDFLERTKMTGEIVTWAGDWIELSREGGTGPEFLIYGASEYDYLPVVLVNIYSGDGSLNRPLDDSVKKTYKESIVSFAKKNKPAYIGMGIEINTLYERSPEDFDKFVSLFNDSYYAIKAVSPDTKIFTVFQLEKMKGIDKSLFAGPWNASNAQWELLEKFPQADMIAFTTYPGLRYKDPSEIPSDYYTEIRLHTEKPIAFTETGWFSEIDIAGWESGEQEQAEFVSAFFRLTESVDKEFVIWSFMYDQDIEEPFKSMGLIKSSDGKEKLSWDAWVRSNDI